MSKDGVGPAPGRATAARAHHYVPEFYLAGFTLAGTRDAMLWVCDKHQGKVWQTRPANAAHQRDFYRIAVPGLDADHVEKELAQIEAGAAQLIRDIEATHQLPEGGDIGLLLDFIALQATRVPEHRAWYEQQAARLTKYRTRLALSVPGIFEDALEKMRSDGNDLPGPPTREAALAFLDDESAYTIEISREESVHRMLEMAEAIRGVLEDRHWSLAVISDDSFHFITSDNPVSLVPIGPEPPPFYGFGSPRTEVSMPLTRRLALVGHWDTAAPPVFDADRQLLGLVNDRTHKLAHRFVFSPSDTFTISEIRPTRDPEPRVPR